MYSCYTRYKITKKYHNKAQRHIVPVEQTLKSMTHPNLLTTPMLTPEYSLICRLLIKSESIESCSREPILPDHIVVHTSIGRNPVWAPTYMYTGGSRSSVHPSSLHTLHMLLGKNMMIFNRRRLLYEYHIT